MLGSLRKIWPFKLDLTPDETKFKLKQFENQLPTSLDGETLLTIASPWRLSAVVSLPKRSRAGIGIMRTHLRSPTANITAAEHYSDARVATGLSQQPQQHQGPVTSEPTSLDRRL